MKDELYKCLLFTLERRVMIFQVMLYKKIVFFLGLLTTNGLDIPFRVRDSMTENGLLLACNTGEFRETFYHILSV
jgi:hypothetical protein